MSVERSRRLLELVDDALAIDAADRATWLREICAGDRALESEAAALLDLEPAAEAFLPLNDAEGATLRPTADFEWPAAPPTADFSPGHQLGDFLIDKQIGAGGMGVVYQAQQISLSRPVALKVLPAYLRHSTSAKTRFRREVEAAARLHHTNIVSVHTTGEEDDTLFYAMELVDGPPLSRILEHLRAHPIPELKSSTPHEDFKPEFYEPSASTPAWAITSLVGSSERDAQVAASTPRGLLGAASGDYFDRIAAALADVADALAYAHENDVIHRDVKPSNLLLSSDGRLHISDFGLARFMQAPGLTRTGECVGTPFYMSPEQISSGTEVVDGRADVYALGATLYELLTLRPPFVGDSRERVIAQITGSEPVPPRRLNKRVPHDLQTICLKALEKDPAHRYQTATQLGGDLRSYVNRFAISAKRPGPVARTMKWARRHQGLSAALVLACSLAVLTLLFAYRAHQSQSLWTEAQQQQVFEQALLAALEGKSEDVRTAVDEAKRLSAPPGRLNLLEGQVDLVAAKYTHAYKHFEQAVVQLPNNVAAHSLLALSCMRRQKYKQGERIFLRTQELQPVTLEDYLHKARVEAYFDPATAAKTLDEAVERDRSSLVARLIRGEVQTQRALDTADPAIAEAALDDYLVTSELLGNTPLVTSSHLIALLAAATAYEVHGQQARRDNTVRAAEDTANLLAQLNTFRAKRALAFYYGYTGDIERALIRWREIQYRETLFLVLTLFREGRFDEALETFSHVERGPTTDRMIKFFHALINAAVKDSPTDVREAFPAVGQVKLNPIIEMLTVYTISCLVDSPEETRHQCQRLGGPQSLPAFRGHWYHQLAKYACGEISSTSLLAAAGSSRKNWCEGHYYIGISSLAAGDRKTAIQHFEKSVAAKLFLYFEHFLSQALLAQLDRDPNWPVWIPVE